MTLREKLESDLKDAMRAHDQVRLDTIRNIKSAVKYKEVEGTEMKVLDDAGILKIISGLVKQRRDSVDQFKAGGRQDLADKELSELAILQTFLPQPLSEAELAALVNEAIKETGATDIKAMGGVIKAVQTKAAGRAEGKAISELVKKRLAGG